MNYRKTFVDICKRLPFLGDILHDRERLRKSLTDITIERDQLADVLDRADAYRLELQRKNEQSKNNVITSLSRPLPIPEGETEQTLLDFVKSVRVSGAPLAEMQNYASQDFRRFVYTLGLVQKLDGKCLELGANPYFTTMLLKFFTKLDLRLANFFGKDLKGIEIQTVEYTSPIDKKPYHFDFEYQHFNIENDAFPYADNTFDIVIFAEIIEHLLNDPCKVLREIKRVLKTNGTLILTTPNVARLENVARLVSGTNMYDPYSGYGAYGRHNREYNVHELVTLLKYEGFDIEEHFTSDVHQNYADNFYDLSKLYPLVDYRANDLGQYIFIKAKNTLAQSTKRPAWLYRSLPAEMIDAVYL